MIENLAKLIGHGTKPYTFLSKVVFENKISRIFMTVLFSVLMVALIGLIFYSLLFVKDENERKYIFENFLPFIVIPLATIGFLYMLYMQEIYNAKYEEEISDLRSERKEITDKIEKDNDYDIFNTIQLSLNQLNEYYTINKNQAKSSFRISLISIIIGFVTIVTGIWFYYFEISSIELSFLTGISGLLLEFIGGAYFFVYKKSLEQVNFFFAQLIKVQDTMLAINLAENIEILDKKNEMTEKIVISLLERSLK
ncbi:hypothetical protein SAMN05660477_00005 [Soonwooa buanensis]|uniref:Cyanobacterial TRADD-N associated 2 transmembrane domain-containing protein n=1 Tax=Soonwooa buanensis TaxID=619805 RepID=A0A1T5CFH4_9FLAO|nr:hypothetical protein [Soonwooa buanensis]SKB57850.1 hypothetical protein SAMN05660477_00005 [Soonwooa buanensis]